MAINKLNLLHQAKNPAFTFRICSFGIAMSKLVHSVSMSSGEIPVNIAAVWWKSLFLTLALDCHRTWHLCIMVKTRKIKEWCDWNRSSARFNRCFAWSFKDKRRLWLSGVKVVLQSSRVTVVLWSGGVTCGALASVCRGPGWTTKGNGKYLPESPVTWLQGGNKSGAQDCNSHRRKRERLFLRHDSRIEPYHCDELYNLELLLCVISNPNFGTANNLHVSLPTKLGGFNQTWIKEFHCHNKFHWPSCRFIHVLSQHAAPVHWILWYWPLLVAGRCLLM